MGINLSVITTQPVLIYLYGPPASGKLTIAEALHELTGLALFHNHLTVNAVRSIFPFDSDAYVEVVHRRRLDVFATAARTGRSLIFTNNSAWRGPDARARFTTFATQCQTEVERHGGRVLFARLSAPLSTLEQRLDSNERRRYEKLLDVGELRELVQGRDLSLLHAVDVDIDTSTLGAHDAAHVIASALR